MGIKSRLKAQFEGFVFFHQYLGNRIIVVVSFSLFVGFLDSIGLSLFLPLLQMFDEGKRGTGAITEDLGNLRFLVDGVESLGIPFGFVSVLLLMCFFFLVKGVFVFAESAYTSYIQQLFTKKLRRDCIDQFIAIDYEYFVKADAGQIQNALTGEVTRVTQAFNSYFLTLQQLILMVVYMGFAFFIDVQFAIMVSIGGAATNLIFKRLNTETKKASVSFSRETNLFQSLIIQKVGNFKYLKATDHSRPYAQKLAEKIEDLKKLGMKIGIFSAILKGAREPVIIAVVCSVIFIQAEVLGAPLGPILISLLFFYRGLTSILGAQTSWNYYLANVGAIVNVKEFMHGLVTNTEKVVPESPDFSKELTFTNVGLKLGNKFVIREIDLTIPKYDTIAIVGESGSGKTSLINVISGLYPVTEGTVLIDGKEVASLCNPAHRSRVGYITQEPVIFNDTLFNNITLWAEASPENKAKFENVIDQTSLRSFLNELELKEEAILGINGVNLSGGQKQRISIARELFKEASLLILDEATSALDTETEREIQEAIYNLKGKYTILMIAHRLSTVRKADSILLMSNGKIIDRGPFEELMKRQPRFQSMVELQSF